MCMPARLGNCQNHAIGDSALSAPVNDQDGEPHTDEITTQDLMTSRPHEEDVPIPEASRNLESNNFQPSYTPVHDLTFSWRDLNGEEVDRELSEAYDEVVHWCRNLFKIPSSGQGKAFVQEMASLFQSYADASAREKVALKAAMVYPALVLQKPFKASKSKDHIKCIERRHSLWRRGDFKALLEEGRAIQGRLHPNRRAENPQTARRFADLMGQSKVKATRVISNGGSSKVLPLSDQVDEHQKVYDVLLEKHPAGGELQPDIVAEPTGRTVHPVIFEEITGYPSWRQHCIQRAVWVLRDWMPMHGRECSVFFPETVHRSLCGYCYDSKKAFVDPIPLAPLTACRLVALDKCPGVRPVGVGEVVRRIICKSILSVIRPEIRAMVGSSQLCAGQKCGCEAAVHALEAIFEEETTEGVILVDASNAVKYLGVIVDKQVSWKLHIANVRRVCLGKVAANRRASVYLPMQVRKMLHSSFVIPHLDYCSTVWHNCGAVLTGRVERIQNYALRVILKKPSRSDTMEMRRQAGLNTLERRRLSPSTSPQMLARPCP